MNRVGRLNPDRIWSEISIALLDHQGIIPVNAAHLDKTRSTDVISFAYPPLPPSALWTGEVIVNVEMALEQGRRRQNVSRELALYIAHGCDHLGGAEDGTPEQRRRMRRRELRWLRELDYEEIISE